MSFTRNPLLAFNELDRTKSLANPHAALLAAGISALAKQKRRALAASLAIGSMAISFLLSVWAFAHVLILRGSADVTQQFFNFRWFQFGNEWLSLGWVLNPLTAVMLVMVTFVGLLIFIFSVGYMEHDENFTRFFCFLALFAGAMLGVIISNSLLLLFMCWEIVGLTSYLLIGFWFEKPERRCRRQESLHHHPHRRSSLLPRDGLALLSIRNAPLLQQRRGMPRARFHLSSARPDDIDWRLRSQPALPC